jgi:hypothetical protein
LRPGGGTSHPRCTRAIGRSSSVGRATCRGRGPVDVTTADSQRGAGTPGGPAPMSRTVRRSSLGAE